jgi:hypothetical protein
MKKLSYLLALILLTLLTVSSCRTPRERAERLVKRANRIYPIDSIVAHKVLIDTILYYDTVVVAKGDNIKFSLPVTKKDTTYSKEDKETKKKPIIKDKLIEYKNTTIFENFKAKVTVSSNKNGNLDYNVIIKDQNIRVQGSIKYKKLVVTYRTLITVHEKTWFHYIGIGLSIFIALYIIITSIRTIKEKLK